MGYLAVIFSGAAVLLLLLLWMRKKHRKGLHQDKIS
ncbi:MAG: hypothetical protein ACI4ET_14445 [Bilifractor sp.]